MDIAAYYWADIPTKQSSPARSNRSPRRRRQSRRRPRPVRRPGLVWSVVWKSRCWSVHFHGNIWEHVIEFILNGDYFTGFSMVDYQISRWNCDFQEWITSILNGYVFHIFGDEYVFGWSPLVSKLYVCGGQSKSGLGLSNIYDYHMNWKYGWEP